MKKRLDILTFEQGLADSREKAKVLIMAGEIFVNGQREDKPGDTFEETVKLEHHGKALPYVSRGGLKLEKAMNTFPIELTGKTCMDVGASTGGFTDCMLQKGAVKVFAVDVGYGQLAWKLRNDGRVIVLEKTNARFLTSEIITSPAEFVSIDVSFISLTLILQSVSSVMSSDGQLVCLIKPQFEAGKDKVGKKGVVRDKEVHREVIEKVINYCGTIDLDILGLTFSPVKGPEGNIEYLVWLSKVPEPTGKTAEEFKDIIFSIVEEAHQALDK